MRIPHHLFYNNFNKATVLTELSLLTAQTSCAAADFKLFFCIIFRVDSKWHAFNNNVSPNSWWAVEELNPTLAHLPPELFSFLKSLALFRARTTAIANVVTDLICASLAVQWVCAVSFWKENWACWGSAFHCFAMTKWQLWLKRHSTFWIVTLWLCIIE